jgi:hypothetical protein
MLPRADFRPRYFEDFIQQKGYRVLWEKSVPCPCIDSKTMHPVPDCKECDGRGRNFYASETIKGLITRQDKELQIGDAIGALEPGRAFLTVSHDKFLSPFDRITNLDSTTVYSETLLHSEKSGDWLRYKPIGNILEAFVQPTRYSSLVSLKQNQDYKVGDDNSIEWLIATNRPANLQGVSLRYFYNPVWLVTNLVNYVRDTWVTFENPVDTSMNLPIRAEIRLEYLGMGVTA